MKKKCPFCASLTIERRGVRRGKERLYCRTCTKWFQIQRRPPKIDAKSCVLLHMSGLPFRRVAEIQRCGVATAYRKVCTELEKLPTCIDVTRQYCQKFSGILQVDGKYLSVSPYDR